jgi:hypothetical protein
MRHFKILVFYFTGWNKMSQVVYLPPNTYVPLDVHCTSPDECCTPRICIYILLYVIYPKCEYIRPAIRYVHLNVCSVPPDIRWRRNDRKYFTFIKATFLWFTLPHYQQVDSTASIGRMIAER